MNIELSVNDNALMQAFSHKQKKLEKAMQRAVRKTHKWLLRQLTIAIAKETLISQKGITPRVFSNFDKKTLKGSVWVGLNPVSATKAGQPRQTKVGVSAGKYRFDGAFVAQFGSAPENVYRRKGRERMPVIKETIDIKEPGYKVIKRIESQAKHYFNQRLAEELNYALNIES